ncbi:hypothetical protein GGR09_000623 [Bartonella heixiaziensis]
MPHEYYAGDVAVVLVRLLPSFLQCERLFFERIVLCFFIR